MGDMSVLIKDMEMPKSCEDCPCAYFTAGVHHDYCQAIGYDSEIKYGSGWKLDNCTLVPAADVVPVRHGRWFLDGDYEYINCSVCQYPFYMGFETSSEARKYLSRDDKWKYCPNCGAIMDKDGDGA